SGPKDVAIVGNEAQVEEQIRGMASAGATEFVAAAFPADGDAQKSLERTKALVKSLVGKI
ncbi:MAG: LLM class F420-dependent oxidoreductase, partial [Chloroflexi bacterium]|nr:LLM class F420-dependent oxidoreductase [Chloroflexota bacterium]